MIARIIPLFLIMLVCMPGNVFGIYVPFSRWGYATYERPDINYTRELKTIMDLQTQKIFKHAYEKFDPEERKRYAAILAAMQTHVGSWFRHVKVPAQLGKESELCGLTRTALELDAAILRAEYEPSCPRVPSKIDPKLWADVRVLYDTNAKIAGLINYAVPPFPAFAEENHDSFLDKKWWPVYVIAGTFIGLVLLIMILGKGYKRRNSNIPDSFFVGIVFLCVCFVVFFVVMSWSGYFAY